MKMIVNSNRDEFPIFDLKKRSKKSTKMFNAILELNFIPNFITLNQNLCFQLTCVWHLSPGVFLSSSVCSLIMRLASSSPPIAIVCSVMSFLISSVASSYLLYEVRTKKARINLLAASFNSASVHIFSHWVLNLEVSVAESAPDIELPSGA